MKKVPDPAGKKSRDPTDSGSSSLISYFESGFVLKGEQAYISCISKNMDG